VKVVLGIGNPGAEYEGTRHNVGFAVIDRLAARFKARRRRQSALYLSWRARPFGEEVCFVKPTTYVNRSGAAAAEIVAGGEAAPDEVLVVCDDLALPPGRIRIRPSGSDGGHNGLRSIIGALGTQGFPRLRIGIGAAPAATDAADYVLEPPAPEERLAILEACERAADAVTLWLREGRLEACMNRYNA
jgi:PTH1 family peptidyl-tRNA hydrolase